jgi:hypothetical protein
VSESNAPVEVTRESSAPPDRVYELISDVTRMGEWSPETTACVWLGGATGPEVGARFRGRNQIAWRRWSTTCTVTAADPGRRFAFRVTSGPLAVADWAFDIEPTPDGCRVTESFTDQRGWLITTGGRLITGVSDRGEHNRASMGTTLDNLVAAAAG